MADIEVKSQTPFQVTWMPSGMDALADLAKRTGEPKLKFRLAEIVEEIQSALQQIPRSWGDPRANLKGMDAKLFVRTYVFDGLQVIYAVHNSKPQVFVKGVEAIQDGPFDS